MKFLSYSHFEGCCTLVLLIHQVLDAPLEVTLGCLRANVAECEAYRDLMRTVTAELFDIAQGIVKCVTDAELFCGEEFGNQAHSVATGQRHVICIPVHYRDSSSVESAYPDSLLY